MKFIYLTIQQEASLREWLKERIESLLKLTDDLSIKEYESLANLYQQLVNAQALQHDEPRMTENAKEEKEYLTLLAELKELREKINIDSLFFANLAVEGKKRVQHTDENQNQIAIKEQGFERVQASFRKEYDDQQESPVFNGITPEEEVVKDVEKYIVNQKENKAFEEEEKNRKEINESKFYTSFLKETGK